MPSLHRFLRKAMVLWKEPEVPGSEGLRSVRFCVQCTQLTTVCLLEWDARNQSRRKKAEGPGKGEWRRSKKGE